MTVFSQETEPITLDTLGGPAPDPQWKYEDKAGHMHRAYADAAKPTWPTLAWVVDETYWCESCQDEHEDGHWECAICGEHIEPDMVMKPPERKTVPGRITRQINGVPVSDEVWEKALKIHRKAEAEIDALVKREAGFVYGDVGPAR